MKLYNLEMTNSSSKTETLELADEHGDLSPAQKEELDADLNWRDIARREVASGMNSKPNFWSLGSASSTFLTCRDLDLLTRKLVLLAWILSCYIPRSFL